MQASEAIQESTTPEQASVVEVVVVKKPRQRDAGRISEGDEASLSWYFGLGLSIYDRSTFGAILNKLAMDAFSSSVCAKCEGHGILEKGGIAVATKCRSCNGEGKIADGKKWCPSCAGFGKVERYELTVDAGGWCPSCRGTGSSSLERRAQRRTLCTVCQRGPNRRSCAHCLGTGHEPLTARPHPPSHDSAGVMPDDSALTRFAITSRRVDAVRKKSPALVEILATYYGDTGQRWGLTERGRLFSLFSLTPCGKRLARWDERAEHGTDLHLSAQERIGNQAAIDQSQPKRERTRLLVEAATQAQELYARAAQAWNLHGRSGKAKDQDQQVLQRLATRLDGMGCKHASAHISALAKAGG